MTAPTPDLLVTEVTMPEHGVFLVRCAATPPPRGAEVLVTLDYGLDLGTAGETRPYEPARHGARIPGFQLVRAKTDDDDRALAENARLAASMCAMFLRGAQAAVPDLRIPYARLSFGRTRLFLRYLAEAPAAALAPASEELRRRFGLSVNVWQMGPRDEVALLGGLGPCGRACCCCTWQKTFPGRLTTGRVRAQGGAQTTLNGACGRFKCCLAFENQEGTMP